MNLSGFVSSNPFLFSNRDFYPWILSKAAAQQWVLFLGPVGFDLEGLGKYCWNGVQRMDRPFFTVHGREFRKASQIRNIMNLIGAGDLLVKDIHLLDERLLSVLKECKAAYPLVRIIAGSESDSFVVNHANVDPLFETKVFHIVSLNDRRGDIPALMNYIVGERLKIAKTAESFFLPLRFQEDFRSLESMVIQLLRFCFIRKETVCDARVAEDFLNSFHPSFDYQIERYIKSEFLLLLAKQYGHRNLLSRLEVLVFKEALAEANSCKSLAARKLRMSTSSFVSKYENLRRQFQDCFINE